MIRIVFGLFFCCVAAGGVARAPVAETISRPNVFLIAIVTLRADHMHCYGHGPIQAPALDKLAKEGVRFAQAFTVARNSLYQTRPTNRINRLDQPCKDDLQVQNSSLNHNSPEPAE
jgi:Sulfatase